MNPMYEEIEQCTRKAVKELFGGDADNVKVQLEKTNKDFIGDITLVVFPFLKMSKKSPEQTGEIIGSYLKENLSQITDFNVVKGFLNLNLASSEYLKSFVQITLTSRYGIKEVDKNSPAYVVEYSSPNTNKPLHLGHIRNNLLGWSVAEILKANGKNVIKVNLVNDRGIHICKSMLAWQLFGQGETPESSMIKGDHLVGKYYVLFNTHYQNQIRELVENGADKETAEKKAPILLQAHEMLRKWEAGDPQVIELWKKMNGWVYDGFEETYKKLGVDFDKIYYESQTYLLGKAIVLHGVEKGILQKHPDASIWADLRDEGLDEKLLLRSDGTSVYMTQDLGTAEQRQKDFQAKKLLYVVGNEQNYHFDVLKRVLSKLGYNWSDGLEHLSYGMVELPEGKMKSREGTVVDADDLILDMNETARQTTEELGKSEGVSPELYHQIAMGALKYFMLKVDPGKNMLFNPKESIDFNGNTGPFIQYTHARIYSLLRKAEIGLNGFISWNAEYISSLLLHKEKEVIKRLEEYPQMVCLAGKSYSPALIANYIFDLAKDFNAFYQETPILREKDEEIRNFRLALAQSTAKVLASGLHLLGISAPEKM